MGRRVIDDGISSRRHGPADPVEQAANNDTKSLLERIYVMKNLAIRAVLGTLVLGLIPSFAYADRRGYERHDRYDRHDRYEHRDYHDHDRGRGGFDFSFGFGTYYPDSYSYYSGSYYPSYSYRYVPDDYCAAPRYYYAPSVRYYDYDRPSYRYGGGYYDRR